MPEDEFVFTGQLWIWKAETAPASWYFITLPVEIGQKIKFFSSMKSAFGSVRVTAQIGDTKWQTSLFPEKTIGSYMLPVKAAVRSAQNLSAGQKARVTLKLA